MIACGGGKNGSGSQAYFAVANSHTARKTPSATSQGLRLRKACPARPRRSATRLANSTMAAMMKAAIATSCVRAQSPTSARTRQAAPNAAQASAAATPGKALRSLSARPPPRDCAPLAATSSRENVDTDPLREFGGIGARLEHRDDLQIVGIGLELLLERRPGRMMVMGVVAHHALDIREARLLRRIRLERLRCLGRI